MLIYRIFIGLLSFLSFTLLNINDMLYHNCMKSTVLLKTTKNDLRAIKETYANHYRNLTK